MAMTIVVTGKVYNGSVHGWKDKDKTERSMYRGRLNYRDRTNGEWHWIDVVCWKDFGKEDGLVGFLEKHFSAESSNAPKEHGGQPIEIVGYLRPSISKMTVPVDGIKNGKPYTHEFKNVDNPTFELVIDTVDFPPSNDKAESTGKKKNVADSEFNFDDIDEDDESDVIVEEEDEVVEAPKKQKKTTATDAAKKKKAAAAKKKAAALKALAEAEAEEDDDDEDEDGGSFFDE